MHHIRLHQLMYHALRKQAKELADQMIHCRAYQLRFLLVQISIENVMHSDTPVKLSDSLALVPSSLDGYLVDLDHTQQFLSILKFIV
ncbi:hypothetical protein TNCT_622871 [Trichonephila clavata]|uniref:Uncharacterized protein n=1 Tax=Trichonephila clavata TaxID=2740835 RepID=A0A8X6HVJ6_TRICU|nr:hypothetical protein TNCT_622871 [Trichonephila clavata]